MRKMRASVKIDIQKKIFFCKIPKNCCRQSVHYDSNLNNIPLKDVRICFLLLFFAAFLLACDRGWPQGWELMTTVTETVLSQKVLHDKAEFKIKWVMTPLAISHNFSTLITHETKI